MTYIVPVQVRTYEGGGIKFHAGLLTVDSASPARQRGEVCPTCHRAFGWSASRVGYTVTEKGHAWLRENR
jgi:hypothetical protein